MTVAQNPIAAAAIARINAANAAAAQQASKPVDGLVNPTPSPAPSGVAKPKTYYNRLANSGFWVQVEPTIARQVIFHGPANGIGEYTTTDPIEQQQLDSCADKMGCPIFTKQAVVDPGENEAQRILRDQAAKAAIAAGQADAPKG